MTPVQTVESYGVRLAADGDELVITGNIKALTEDHVTWIRDRKWQLLTELEVTNKLSLIAKELGWPLDDLLDWYHSDLDMHDLACFDHDTVLLVVRDYIQNYDLCRGGG